MDTGDLIYVRDTLLVLLRAELVPDGEGSATRPKRDLRPVAGKQRENAENVLVCIRGNT